MLENTLVLHLSVVVSQLTPPSHFFRVNQSKHEFIIIISFVFAVPSPSVSISRSRSGTLYASTNFTLTCIVTLGSSIRSLGLSVNISWSGLPSSQYSTTSTVAGSGGIYTSNLTISPLTTSHSGGYTCRAAVSGTNIFSNNASSYTHLSVRGN